jgi:DNA helicase-2/ATP-dependent DNA helicase PcrA
VASVEADRILDGLNDEQRLAVTATTVPLCILAGAGSGKTRVLTRRIAYRALAGEHDPRHVLALTFTRKAAGELTNRLRRLGLRDTVAAGTFHSVAYAQLRARWHDRGIAAPELLERKVGFVARLLRSGPRSERTSALDVVTEIEWAKARALAPEDYAAEASRTRRQAPMAYREMAALFRRYEDEKRANRLVDFDDLLRLCRRDLLDDRDFAQTQRWRFQHVFVDEFQDVNPLQRQLLEAWVGGRDDLCVVGDPNQAIYAWNGADATALTGFLDRYPRGEILRLTDNYRSSPQILAVANAVLAGATLDPATPADDRAAATGADLRANRPDGPVPTIRGFDDEGAEARAIARAVRDHHGPGARWSAQAVLCRTNAQSVLIEQALHHAGIPFRVRGGGSLLDRPEVKQALHDLRRHTGDFHAAVADLDAAAVRPSRPAPSAGDDDGEDPAGGAPASEIDRAAALDDDRTANLATLARLAHDFAAVDARPTAAGFGAWLQATTAGERPDGNGDAVEIATFHAAKGLEWPVVHLAGLEDGLVPIGHAKDAVARAEERRLFYVAVTRAERELLCTWAERRTFGERESWRERSPYLGEVEAACRALAADERPTTWTTYLAAQRATLRDLTGSAGRDHHATPTRSGRAESGPPQSGRNQSGRNQSGAARVRSVHERSRSAAAADLDAVGLATFDALKAWRTTQARAAAVAPHVIFHDQVLLEVAATRPRTSHDLLAVRGVGQVKVRRFGPAILGIVAEHAPS